MTMAILESTKSQIAGIDVQPIINHGTPAWRIFKPGGDGVYICQFSLAAAAVTIMRWTREVASWPDVRERLEGMHREK